MSQHGRHNKIPQTGCLKQGNLVLRVLDAGCAGGVGRRGSPSSWNVDGSLLTVSSPGRSYMHMLPGVSPLLMKTQSDWIRIPLS